MDIATHNQTLTAGPISGKFWAVAMSLCIAAGMAAALWGWPLAFAPLAIGVVLTCILKPDWGLYFLVGALFFPYKITSTPAFYPADVILFLVVIGFWMQRARHGKLGLIRTPLDLPIAVWLGIMALSLVNAHDVTRGIINWLRHVQLFLLFYAIAGQVNSRQAQRLLVVLVLGAAIFSAINLPLFIQFGGLKRIIGIARPSLIGLLSVCIVYVTGLFCFARRRARATLYIILLILLFLGQVATQSRWGIVASIIGIGVVLILSWRWGSVHADPLPRRRARLLAIFGAAFIAIIFILAFPMIENVIQRFNQVGSAATTVNYRLFIWKTAWNIYLDHPLLGIGLGQAQIWGNIFPSLRLERLGSLTFGFGTHHTLLKYMAETGTLGTLALFWLWVRIARVGSGLFQRVNSPEIMGHIAGILGVISIIFFRLFTEGRMFYAIPGITTVLFLALLINLWMSNQAKQ